LNLRFNVVKKLYNSNKTVVLSTLIGLAAFSMFYLFFFKENSSYGRLLIWSVSFQNIGQYFLSGIGIGKFSTYYPVWQINYFKNNYDHHERFFLVADETFLPFNEYLGIFIEYGFIGFSLFCFFVYKGILMKNSECHLFLYIKLSFIAILIASATSYPLHVNSILIHFGLCSIFIFSNYFDKIHQLFNLKSVRSIKIISCCLALAMLFNFVNILKTSVLVYKWNIAEYSADIDLYNNLYTKLSNYPKFLLAYSEKLESGNCKFKISILKEAQNEINNANVYLGLFESYNNCNYEREALSVLNDLYYLVPNRMSFKYIQMNYLESKALYKDAILIGKEIVKMPVKVKSETTEKMQYEASILVRKLEKAGF